MVGGLRAAFGSAALLALVATVRAQPGAQQQKVAPPKWLDDEGKDIFSDLEGSDDFYGDSACELRERLLKKMAGKGDKEASDHRGRVLVGLGMCQLKRGEYKVSKMRLESAISEWNIPSEDWMLQNQQVAHIALIKQAAAFLQKFEVTQGGTALRRAREICDRNLKKILKMVHKQMPEGQRPPLENMIDELPGLGKTGNILPTVVKQVPMLLQEMALAKVVEQVLVDLDRRIGTVDSSLKSKRLRLETSKGIKGKEKGGLMYVHALLSEAVVPADRSEVAHELLSGGAIDAFKKEAAGSDKGATLIKRTKEGPGCKKGFEATCEALTKIADVASNGFGESRVVVVKGGKPQALDVCETNANIAVLVAAKDGVKAKLKDAPAVELSAGEPVVVDFCREVTLESDSTVSVLFVQTWHPEFAALERSTELRSRSKAFGFSEDDVKATTKVVNDAAKKQWDKTANLWRKDSEGHTALVKALENEVQEKAKKEEEAAEAKRLEEDVGDEEKKAKLEALEAKRVAKRQRAEEAEAKKEARRKQLEQERANRDPWLNFPSVTAAEQKLAELKEARRDANAKLEFELSTQLTKDIGAQERAVAKAQKKAKKLHKKGGTAEDDRKAMGDAGAADADKDDKEDDEKPQAKVEEKPKAKGKEEKPQAKGKDKVEEKPKAKAKEEKPKAKEEAKKPAKKDNSKELKDLQKKLDEVNKKKKEAADKDDFKTAKKLKQEADELQKNIKKLEL